MRMRTLVRTEGSIDQLGLGLGLGLGLELGLGAVSKALSATTTGTGRGAVSKAEVINERTFCMCIQNTLCVPQFTSRQRLKRKGTRSHTCTAAAIVATLGSAVLSKQYHLYPVCGLLARHKEVVTDFNPLLSADLTL
jgi:hypothetical protein